MTLNESKEAHAAAIELHKTAIDTAAGLRQARDEAALAFARAPTDKKLAQSFQAARQALDHAVDHERAFDMLTAETAAAVLEAERAEAMAAAESAAQARARCVAEAGDLLRAATELEASARELRQKLAAIIEARVAALPASSSMSDRERERETFVNDARAAAGQPRLDWLGHEIDAMGRRAA